MSEEYTTLVGLYHDARYRETDKGNIFWRDGDDNPVGIAKVSQVSGYAPVYVFTPEEMDGLDPTDLRQKTFGTRKALHMWVLYLIQVNKDAGC